MNLPCHLRLLAPAAVSLLFVRCQAQTSYIVHSKFGNGEAVSFRTRNMRGEIQYGRLITFAKNRSVDMAEMFGPDGSLAWVSEKDTLSGELRRNSIYMSDRGIKLSTTRGGKTKNQLLPYPPGSNFRDAGSRWFIDVRPKLGEVARFTNFDPVDGVLYPEKICYVGERVLLFRAKKVVLHVLVGTREKDWVDDEGVVYRAELALGKTVLTRK